MPNENKRTVPPGVITLRFADEKTKLRFIEEELAISMLQMMQDPKGSLRFLTDNATNGTCHSLATFQSVCTLLLAPPEILDVIGYDTTKLRLAEKARKAASVHEELLKKN